MLSMIHPTWRTQQITFACGNNLTKVGTFEHQARLVSGSNEAVCQTLAPPMRQALWLSFQVSEPGSPGAGTVKVRHASQGDEVRLTRFSGDGGEKFSPAA